MKIFESRLLNNKYISIYRDSELKAFYDVPPPIQRKVIYAHLIIHSVVLIALFSFLYLFTEGILFVSGALLGLLLYGFIGIETASYMNERTRHLLKKYYWVSVLLLSVLAGLLGAQIGAAAFQPDTSFLSFFLPFMGAIFTAILVFIWAQFGVSKLLEASGVLHSNMARIESDVRFASEVQKRLLKKEEIKNDATGLQASASSLPASELGGDFFELSKSENQLFAAVGDISGHSFGAGLLMSMTKSALQTHLSYTGDPARVMDSLNHMLLKQSDRSMFATMVLMRLDLITRKAALCNAGHVPVFHYVNETKTLETRYRKGVALGMSSRASYENLAFETSPGDLIILYSDGLVETRDEAGQIRDAGFFEELVVKLLREHHPAKTPDEIADLLLQEVIKTDHASEREDDITLVVVGV